MKVKASLSFAGAISMAMGEVRDVPESIAAPLVKCGYLQTVEEPAPPANPETPANPEPPAGGKDSSSGKNTKTKGSKQTTASEE